MDLRDLTTPDQNVAAPKVDLDRSVLAARVVLTNDDGSVIVRKKEFFVNLNDEGHPVAVQNKVKQAIIDMAVYLGLMPPQP